MCVWVFDSPWHVRRLRRATNSEPLTMQPQRDYLCRTSPYPYHTPTIPCRPASRRPPPRTGTHSLLIDAFRTAFRRNDAREPSCVSRSIRGARDGRAMVQSESSGLDRRARGFANITVGSCAYNTRGRAVGTVSMPGSNAAICHTSCSRTVIEGPARARGRSLELDLVWSDRGRSGQEAVVCEHVANDPSLQPGCHASRWVRGEEGVGRDGDLG